jgi:hypothetical protein
MKLLATLRLDLALAALVCGLAGAGSVPSAGRRTDPPEPRPAAGAQATTKSAPQPSRGNAADGNAARSIPHPRGGAADSAPSRAPQTVDAAEAALESARQRWERLTPEQKIRARERYEKYVALSDAERRELAERAQRLKENSLRVQRELTPEMRERLSSLEPEKRVELIGELAESEAKEQGQRLREMLPENVRKRLEAARPEDRARYLAEFKAKQSKRLARLAIDQIGRRLSLPPGEIERLKSLPDDERAEAVLELKKKLTEHEAQVFGLPPGISQREWEEWEKLPPEEFFGVMQRYQHMRAAHRAAAEEARENARPDLPSPVRPGKAGGIAPGAGQDAVREPDGGRPESRLGIDSQGAHVSPERSRALHRLSEARRLRPDDFLELADLTRFERAIRVEHRRRERCMAAIREGQLLPPDRSAALAQVSDAEFFREVRKLLAR